MQLTVVDSQIKKVRLFELGDNLLSILREGGSAIHAPCGGRGTCGKCHVEISGIGSVLACQTDLTPDLLARAAQPLTVTLPDEVKAQISTDGLLPDVIFNPLVFKGSVQLPPPSLGDQRPDDERFEAATGLTVPFRLLGQLAAALRKTDFSPSFYCLAGRDGKPGQVLRFVEADSPDPLGLAVDIGTTTLAAYLYDLGSGKRLGSASALNPQNAYGADIISRIDQAASSSAMKDTLRDSIAKAIAELTETIAKRASIQSGRPYVPGDIVHYVLAGNTTMLHLLTGLPAASIAKAPFIPVSRCVQTLTAAELRLPVAPDACCQLLPSIASYVGADITAGILACDLLESGREGGSLLIDIGTNGEIVASGPNGAVACSTAAGPAFEGANIRCGIGGVQGAVDEVIWDGQDLSYTLIRTNGNGDKPLLARGICGSGLVAAVASLLESGLLEDTGRITDDVDQLPEVLRQRILEIDGQPAVQIVPPGESADGQPIVLTQKDIRELQNAKAAIAAGIELLIDRAGLDAKTISQVFIAGGFGNYLDVLHAFRIGMLPSDLRGRTCAAGNTSGMGAVLCLLNMDSIAQASEIVDRVEYFELSGDKRFTDLYIDAMLFPETGDSE